MKILLRAWIIFALVSMSCVHGLELQDDSGKKKIAAIMSRAQADIIPGASKPVMYSSTAHISEDLNIPAMATFFRCKTTMGNNFLKKSLEQPLSPADTSGLLPLRKNAIDQLIKNPDLKKQIDSIMQTVAEEEETVEKLMSSGFKAEACPYLDESGIRKKTFIEKFQISYHRDQTFKTIFLVYGAISMVSSLGLLAKELYEHGPKLINFEVTKKSVLATNLLAGLFAGFQLFVEYRESFEKRKTMHSLHALLSAAESIENLCNQSNITTQHRLSFVKNPQGLAVIRGLLASRYKDKNAYVFNSAAVDTFLYKLYEHDEQLAQAFASIAEMDTYNAIASRILEHQDVENQFCYAQPIESLQPKINAQGFWNVLIKKPVINNMLLDRNIIINGANAGGKSTFIRSMLQNILLAQTYGIAAGTTFEYTPFDTIFSSLNISDNVLEGDSLFASEIKRAQEILQTIRSLPENQKLFFVIDELFTGTAAKHGEQCAYQFIKKVGTFPAALCIYANHFDILKELGYNSDVFKNYKVDTPVKNELGALVYPYTVSEGASNDNIAIEMAKQAGIFED